MRLLSHATPRGERLAALVGDDGVVDLDELLGDGPWTMARLLADGHGTQAAIRAALDRRPAARRSVADLIVLAPVPRPGKVIGVGRNYREHAAEEGTSAPAEPVLFAKFSSS